MTKNEMIKTILEMKKEAFDDCYYYEFNYGPNHKVTFYFNCVYKAFIEVVKALGINNINKTTKLSKINIISILNKMRGDISFVMYDIEENGGYTFIETEISRARYEVLTRICIKLNIM